MKTGLNLDKVHGYLRDYLTNWEKYLKANYVISKYLCPIKSMDDLVGFFGGNTIDITI